MQEQESDAELIARVRAGDDRGFEELWRRHIAAALRLAHRLAPNRPEDLASEAFIALYQQLTVAGNGPKENFRAYLFTSMRNLSYRWNREEAQLKFGDHHETVDQESDALFILEREATAGELFSAFTALPERWQRVLWLSEVERAKRADIAGELGLKPNAVSALLRRARNGLRLQWLTVQVPERLRSDSAHIARDLPALITKQKTEASKPDIRAHLTVCAECRSLETDLRSLYRRTAKLTLSAAGFGALALAAGTTKTAPVSTVAASAAIPLTTAAATSSTSIGVIGTVTAGLATIAATAAVTIMLSVGGVPVESADAAAGDDRDRSSQQSAADAGVSIDRDNRTEAESDEADEADARAERSLVMRQSGGSGLDEGAAETPIEGGPPPYVTDQVGPRVVDPQVPEMKSNYSFDTIQQRPANSGGDEQSDGALVLSVRGFAEVEDPFEIADAATTGVVVEAIVTGTADARVCVHSDSGQSAEFPVNAEGMASIRVLFMSEGFYTVSFAACTDTFTGPWQDYSLYVSDPDIVFGPFPGSIEQQEVIFETS